MIWSKPEIDPDEVRSLARRYGINLISASIMVRRNLTEERAARFLFEDDLRLLHNPFFFRDMERAVERINRAIDRRERIVIFGDRDVDGITSTVLLVQHLKSYGASVDWRLPAGEEDYGLTSRVVEELAGEGYSLLITVDCGISNTAEIALAARKGLETIVADHHNPPEEPPPALAVVNPKLEGCKYPFRELAGCGVAAKLSWALDFSRTDFFGKQVILMHVKPDNETYTVEAARMFNLVEQERLIESVIPGPEGFDLRRTRLSEWLDQEPIIILDRKSQGRLLERICSRSHELNLTDLQDDLQELFPQMTGRSLLIIKEMSHIGRYGARFGEFETLIQLYQSIAFKRLEVLVRNQNHHLDLMALGTLADLMPLVDENRIIVKRGLEVLNRMERVGLRELMIRQKLHDQRVSSTDLSWQITPVLNAAGRMGEPEKTFNLLMASTREEAVPLVEDILELNKRRKVLGDRIWSDSLLQARSSLARMEGKFVLVDNTAIPRGITGILASRLVNTFKVPSIAIAVSEDKAVGSLRSPYPLEGFLDLYDDLFTNYGGHDCAAGFSLQSSVVPEFITRLVSCARSLPQPKQREEQITIDAEVPPRYLTPELIKVVEFFEPYGEGNPALVFLTRGVKIDSLEIIGKREMSHVKLLLSAGRYRWPAVYWNAASKAGSEFDLYDTVDVVYRMNRNYFQNNHTLRLTILDLKR